MTDRELMQQALEALNRSDYLGWQLNIPIIKALRERLAQPEYDCYGYASRLATNLWEAHYKDQSPEWKPLDNLVGVLTQIDNMASGLVKAQPEQEPFCYYDGRNIVGKEYADHCDVVPLYTSPQRTQVGLTDDDKRQVLLGLPDFASYDEIMVATEAKLKEKNT